jgi:hypothetical protein
MTTLNAHGHEYGFESPDFMLYRDPSGHEIRFPYRKGLRVRVSPWTGEVSLKHGRDRVSLSPLKGEELKSFFRELFRSWNQIDQESARKAAFDYADAQRGFMPLAFAACLLVAFPVAIALLSDSHQQFRCTQELETQALPGLMHTVKIRKQDSRTFMLSLEYNAPNGQVIKGQEQVLTEKDVPPPSEFPMFYSPAHPECWALTKTADNHEINWAKRRYFAWFGLLFGLFFLSVTILGLAWCTVRWARPRAFTEEVLVSAGLQEQ